MKLLIMLWSFILVSATTASEYDQNNQNDTINDDMEEPSKILSRRKRFLVFPDGSSFQLVFEHQNHGYMQIGNIVWFSNTAALAWELPTDPQLYYMLKKETKLYGNRRSDTKHIYYLDEDGRVLSKVPYHRKKFLVNPAMGKRSVKGITPKENDACKDMSIKDMHDKEKRRNHFEDLDHRRINFHRSNRKELYEKLEKVLEGLGWNGGECVQRMLCEAGKPKDDQGTFLQEIVKATFTLPRGRGFDSQHKYDVAHGTGGDCAILYPDCKGL